MEILGTGGQRLKWGRGEANSEAILLFRVDFQGAGKSDHCFILVLGFSVLALWTHGAGHSVGSCPGHRGGSVAPLAPMVKGASQVQTTTNVPGTARCPEGGSMAPSENLCIPGRQHSATWASGAQERPRSCTSPPQDPSTSLLEPEQPGCQRGHGVSSGRPGRPAPFYTFTELPAVQAPRKAGWGGRVPGRSPPGKQ